MYKYFDPVTNRSGDSLVGYFVRVFTSAGAAVDIFADESGTPISTVSGVANAAKSDENGMVRFYVANGTYDILYYDSNDTYKATEAGVPLYEASGVYDDLGSTDADKGASLVKFESGDTVEDLASDEAGKGASLVVMEGGGTAEAAILARPTTAALASPSGAGMVGDQLDLPDTEASTQADWNRDRISIMRWIPVNLRAGIRDRSGTTDLSAYIQNALDNCPTGATLYAPAGVYRMASGVSTERGVVLVGDPSRENFDNSWDTGNGGTVFDYRGTTGDAFTFQPPNDTNSRVNVVLRHFAVRHSRVTASGTSGRCIYVNGRAALDGTAVRLDMFDVHVAEAPDEGLHITGDTYGGIIDNVFAHRCGYNGICVDNSGGSAPGEMVFGRIRCFQNGQDATGTEKQKANFVWLAGTLFADMVSASESANGPGAIFGGGPINIGHFQAESNTNGDSLIIGQSGAGVVSFKMGTYLIAPGASYTHSHIHITEHLTGRANLGCGYHGDTLGSGGLHFERDVNAGEITWDVSPVNFASTPVFGDNASSHHTRIPLYVLARDGTGTTNVTGDSTVATWAPGTEIFDAWGAYNSATGEFTAPFSGIFEFRPLIPLSGIVAGHDRSTQYFDATTFARIFRTGNPIGGGNAGGLMTLSETATIPMKQGETCSVKFDVTGGTKVIDTVGDTLYATLEIRSVG